MWSRGAPWIPVSSPDNLLYRIARLVDADDTAVAKFATRYGPLLLCEKHGLPLSHSRHVGVDPDMDEYGCDVAGGRTPFVTTDSYRKLGREVFAVLNLAAILHRGDTTESLSEDWSTLGYDTPIAVDMSVGFTPRESSKEEAVQQQREVLGQYIDQRLDLAAVRLQFGWFASATSNEPRIDIKSSGLFGAVAVTTMLAVAKSDGIAICTSCLGPYAPTQKPKSGRNNYCPDCRERGRSKYYKRRQRAMQAEKS